MSRIGLELASRRDFLGGLFSAGALVFAAGVLPPSLDAAEPDVTKTTWNPSVFLGINSDGSIVIVAHRSEMGTGIRTSLPMIVADELGADWSRVRVEQALGDSKYGSQDTDGSCSIRDFYDMMRATGATARLMLLRAAAAKWNVPVNECKAADHTVVHTSGKSFGYGDLAAAAAQQPMPRKEELQFKSPADFKYIGKGVHRLT